ncbi:MAG: hypothetical protein WDZ35_08325 [Crocinitomicaceae bacterium]
MIYLTVNDAPSGVYKSQVIDVIETLNEYLDEPIQLIALVSVRNFSANKRKIKEWYPKATVMRMIPGLSNWKKNRYVLGLIRGIRTRSILARGPMACWIAQELNKNVIYDGRGAVKAELKEFPEMIPDNKIVDSIIEAEKKAVIESVFRIAVSNKLVSYWQNEFGYEGNNHVVIPCTLSNSVTSSQLIRADSHSAPRLIYAGSTAGWQSFKKVKRYIEHWIQNQDAEVLFLSKLSPEIEELISKFPNQVSQKWVDHKDVHNELVWADYGILIRDENVTNKVASPVKFAEYLSAGLKVLISPHLGDFSALVTELDLGYVVKEEDIDLLKVELREKKRLQEVAQDRFSKKAHSDSFKYLTQFILNTEKNNA